MSQRLGLSRRAALLGVGAIGLGLVGWRAGKALQGRGGPGETPEAGSLSEVKALQWRDLRPSSPEIEAAALRARIEARRRGDLGLPAETGVGESAGRSVSEQARTGLGGFKSHQSAVASDMIDGAWLDTSPAADAPFAWGTGRKPHAAELVASLDRRLVSLPGYAVPFDPDLSGVKSFLLAPYVGACIHVPPPPPNQIVLVTSNAPYRFDALFEPVLVFGEMRVEPVRSQLAEVGYQLRARRIRPFEPDVDAG